MDARHYFHTLAVGRRWRKYLAHPPLGRTAQHAERFPVACSLPMGFAPAASWAQLCTEAATARAALPAEARLVDSRPPPAAPPLWASILD
eukprot:10850348-Lingulodinium_polyedra.AAC.1